MNAERHALPTQPTGKAGSQTGRARITGDLSVVRHRSTRSRPRQLFRCAVTRGLPSGRGPRAYWRAPGTRDRLCLSDDFHRWSLCGSHARRARSRRRHRETDRIEKLRRNAKGAGFRDRPLARLMANILWLRCVATLPQQFAYLALARRGFDFGAFGGRVLTKVTARSSQSRNA